MRSVRSAALALALLSVGGGLGVYAQTSSTPPQLESAAAVAASFDPAVSLQAPIALMLDVGSGRVLFEREADRRFVPASLTKIMTAYVAFELIAAGKLRPDQRFVTSDAAFDEWHRVGSTMFLSRGQAVSVDELLRAIMTVSANDGCIVLAEGAAGSVERFVALMNDHARRLGMTDSHFGSPNGWPDEGATYTTARDLALLTQAMLIRHPELYRAYVGHREMTFNGIRQENHVPLMPSVIGADGIKTGFTNEAGYGLVGSAVRDGRRLVIVVGGYDRAWQRARESRAFIEWGFAAWRVQRLYPAGGVVAEARVQDGAARRLPLAAPLPYYLTLGRGETAGDVRLAVRYRGPLRAPLSKGAQVAELVVTAPDQSERGLPLVAERSVAPAGALARVRNGLLEIVGL